MPNVRRAAVAGTWYPGSAAALKRAVEGHLAHAETDASGDHFQELVALVAPHAGLMYSGPVAAHAYRLLREHPCDVVVLVGPSHFVRFEGVSVYASGGFQTPLGVAEIDEPCATAIMNATAIVGDYPPAHAREHSLEMQLPFIQLVAPASKIVPLVMGSQSSEMSRTLGDALGTVLSGRRALLVASTDLSHYHDSLTASQLDRIVIDHVAGFDEDGLQGALGRRPEHACGGGPTVAVMRAARALGARDAIVLKYADSGDVSGDKSSVVGYMAAAFGTGRLKRVRAVDSSR
jgi:AmmeMemoRadiSam system protein B